jgi:hypothetical protein
MVVRPIANLGNFRVRPLNGRPDIPLFSVLGPAEGRRNQVFYYVKIGKHDLSGAYLLLSLHGRMFAQERNSTAASMRRNNWRLPAAVPDFPQVVFCFLHVTAEFHPRENLKLTQPFPYRQAAACRKTPRKVSFRDEVCAFWLFWNVRWLFHVPLCGVLRHSRAVIDGTR